MGRGRLSAGGSLYYGDLVTGVLESAGVTLPERAKVLDFGASPGRWLAGRLSPNWEMRSYISGNVEGNQDTFLLRAR